MGFLQLGESDDVAGGVYACALVTTFVNTLSTHIDSKTPWALPHEAAREEIEMSNLIKVAASIVALVGMSIPAHSQQFQLESAVVDTCTAVALAEINDENRSTLRGQCLDATRSYL